MNTTITAISTIALLLVVTSTVSSAYADVPSWVKNNAGWWADGTITESEFISGVEFLITDGIIVVPPTTISSETSEGVPDWVKNNAGWWADGIITDGEFVNGVQHLMTMGLVSIPTSEIIQADQDIVISDNSELALLQTELDDCSKITRNYERLNCEKSAKHEIDAYGYKLVSQSFQTGPVTYYWPGFETEGNSFEITSSGQAMLRLRILVENTGSSQEALFCTGPAICNYDVTNGSTSYKYSGMDFTNGQVVLNPGESKVFNMFFGPNIGGGGTTFEYDSVNEYYFRGDEPFGSVSIPLNLG